jgi:hypothetical protein
VKRVLAVLDKCVPDLTAKGWLLVTLAYVGFIALVGVGWPQFFAYMLVLQVETFARGMHEPEDPDADAIASRLALRPGDDVLLKLGEGLTMEDAEQVAAHVRDFFAGKHRVIALSHGVEIEVLECHSDAKCPNVEFDPECSCDHCNGRCTCEPYPSRWRCKP